MNRFSQENWANGTTPNDFLKEAKEKSCPMCKGDGVFRGYKECEKCGGTGKLDSSETEE